MQGTLTLPDKLRERTQRWANLTHPELSEALVQYLTQHHIDAYFVGGCVRDRILGHPLHDLDLVVAGDALALARRLADRLEGAYYTLHQEFATGRILVDDPAGGKITVDISGLRGGSLSADLGLRDFTINAMAVTPADWLADWPSDQTRPVSEDLAGLPIIDLHGGLTDLRYRRIRAISATTFQNDPLRLLRAVRVAADIDGQIESETEELVRRDAGLLTTVSWERIRDEFMRLLAQPGATASLHELDRLSLLGQILPELNPTRGVPQPPPHHLDVFGHSLLTVDCLERVFSASVELAPGLWTPDPFAPYADQIQTYLADVLVGDRPRSVLLKLAGLLHDVGKPSARRVDEAEQIHFFGHERIGTTLAAEICRRLRLGVREVTFVTQVIRNHMRPLSLAKTKAVSRRAIYRFFRDTGNAGMGVVLLAAADALATQDATSNPTHWADFLSVLRLLLDGYYAAERKVVGLPRLITGGELVTEFDLSPGPRIRELLEAVREAQAVGEVATPTEARQLVHRLLSSGAEA